MNKEELIIFENLNFTDINNLLDLDFKEKLLLLKKRDIKLTPLRVLLKQSLLKDVYKIYINVIKNLENSNTIISIKGKPFILYGLNSLGIFIDNTLKELGLRDYYVLNRGIPENYSNNYILDLNQEEKIKKLIKNNKDIIVYVCPIIHFIEIERELKRLGFINILPIYKIIE